MLPRVVLRFHSTATVVQRRARRPGWFTGAAAAAGVVGGTWLATSLYDSGVPDEEVSCYAAVCITAVASGVLNFVVIQL
jgi:hypothetical protein